MFNARICKLIEDIIKNGMLIALAVIIVLVIGPFVWKAIQGGYDTILARFTKASGNADVNSWNK
ncbi:hypothetical protein P4256_24620 [Bacillus wiedmannii]|uniref:hypothetical protein n=1 Tax=Bacillus wiedmannii TaxID=1890302 RepID=UPI002E1CFA55|nr:hypothetical protein [Bacillus wiedmannii]